MSLTPTQFREHAPTSLSDEELQRLLEAADLDIIANSGPLGSLQDRRRGGGLYLFLSRAAASITSVVERYGDLLGLTDVTMDTSDYTLLPDRYTLRREWVGTHRNDRWADSVIVTYTVLDDTAVRERCQIGLVKLEIAYQPGLTAQAIGTWSEQYRNVNYADERAQIFASLTSGVPWFA